MLRSKKGYVYILINEFFDDDLLKIGMTTRSPEIRASELYDKHSGVPGRFKVIHKKRVEDCEFAEALIHKNLGKYRVNDYREFFKVPINQAKAVIDEVCNDISKIHLKQYDKINLPSSFKTDTQNRQIIQISRPVKPPLPPATTSYETEKYYFCKVCSRPFRVGSKHFNYSKRICEKCSAAANNNGLNKDLKKEEQGKGDGETKASKYILCPSCKFKQWVGYDKCQKCGYKLGDGEIVDAGQGKKDGEAQERSVIDLKNKIKWFENGEESVGDGEIRECYYCKKYFQKRAGVLHPTGKFVCNDCEHSIVEPTSKPDSNGAVYAGFVLLSLFSFFIYMLVVF